MNKTVFLSPDMAARELALLGDLIRDSDVRNASRISKHEFEQIVTKVQGSLTQEQVQIFVSKEKRTVSPSATCGAIIAYLRALNTIPDTERARSLRAIYSSD